jgi:hypothetical protein
MTILAAAAAATALGLVTARPAWADTTVSLDQAQLPVTAAASAPNPAGDRVGLTTCDIAPATASDRDVWIFRVTGSPAPDSAPSATAEPTPTAQPASTTGPVLLAVSATFADTGTITVDSSSDGTDGGIIADSAWIAAPPGSTLTAASAGITSDTGTLELIAACPAEPVATADPLAGLLPSATSTAPAAMKSAWPASAPAQTLPVAGTDVVSIAALGAGFVLTGVLLILAHGRRPKLADDPDEDDIRQPVIMIRRF